MELIMCLLIFSISKILNFVVWTENFVKKKIKS